MSAALFIFGNLNKELDQKIRLSGSYKPISWHNLTAKKNSASQIHHSFTGFQITKDTKSHWSVELAGNAEEESP